MILYLDDVRPMPETVDADRFSDNPRKYTHLVKTAEDAIALLETGQVEFISFDHDLGVYYDTGYDVAKWIEEKVHSDPSFVFPDWAIHSANPVGAANIDRCMKAAEAYYRSGR